MSSYNIGDTVSWKWGPGTGAGKVEEVHTETVTKIIKGAEVTRHPTKESPAYTITEEAGDVVLKSHSELINPEEEN